MEEKKTFEDRLGLVKEIIDGIESGQTSLEESVRRYEQGIQQLNTLEKELSEMKRRITVLQQQPDGTAAETPLEESR